MSEDDNIPVTDETEVTAEEEPSIAVEDLVPVKEQEEELPPGTIRVILDPNAKG